MVPSRSFVFRNEQDRSFNPWPNVGNGGSISHRKQCAASFSSQEERLCHAFPPVLSLLSQEHANSPSGHKVPPVCPSQSNSRDDCRIAFHWRQQKTPSFFLESIV